MTEHDLRFTKAQEQAGISFYLLLSELVRLRVGSTGCTLDRSVRINFDTKQPVGPRSIIVYKF